MQRKRGGGLSTATTKGRRKVQRKRGEGLSTAVTKGRRKMQRKGDAEKEGRRLFRN